MNLIGEKLPTLKKQKVNIFQRGNEDIFPNLHQQVQIFSVKDGQKTFIHQALTQKFLQGNQRRVERNIIPSNGKRFAAERTKNIYVDCGSLSRGIGMWCPNSSLHHIFVRCPPQSVVLREDCGTKWRCLGALNNHSFIWDVHEQKSGKEVKPTLFTE